MNNIVNDEVNRAWPKRETVRLYSRRDERRELGERIGLEGNALYEFQHSQSEIELELDINEDGTFDIIKHPLKIKKLLDLKAKEKDA